VEEDENGNEQAIYVNLDRGQMMTALTNLIDNAKKHGFTELKKYLIRFHLGLSPDRKEVILLYKNDGNPFPESFSFDDFVAYGNYAGETGHSGIGGYLIQQIIDNHEGSLSWLEDIPKNDPFKVQFEVVLPVG
jgi:type I restriction enzyme M protein